MTFIESIWVSLFSMTLVFLVLVTLYTLIALFPVILKQFDRRRVDFAGASAESVVLSGTDMAEGAKTVTRTIAEAAEVSAEAIGGAAYRIKGSSSDASSREGIPAFSAGELKLINVDEKTAAMIMAIVSNESGIPLSELCFKSIKAIN